jgi:hypothetical protein
MGKSTISTGPFSGSETVKLPEGNSLFMVCSWWYEYQPIWDISSNFGPWHKVKTMNGGINNENHPQLTTILL